MTEWQTIDTAPKDGTKIIGATESYWGKNWAVLRFPYSFTVSWDGSKWRADDGNVYDPQPTHWTPLPNSPGGVGEREAVIEKLARRLQDAAQAIDNDGTSSQAGLDATECREIATAIRALATAPTAEGTK